GPASPDEWERKAAARTLEGAIYRGVRQVVQEAAEAIRQRFPRILRRVSGYNLDVLCDGLVNGRAGSVSDRSPPVAHAPGSPGIHQVLVGSEGTLAVVTEAELGLIPRPAVRGLLVPHFASLGAAMDALAACLEFHPSAVELMDQMLLDLARGNLSLKNTVAADEGRPAALLMVEFSGDEAAVVADRVARLRQRLGEAAGLTHSVPAPHPP